MEQPGYFSEIDYNRVITHSKVPARGRLETLSRDLNAYTRSTNIAGNIHKKEMKK